MTRSEETIIVRGVAAAIQAMAMPTMENLSQLLYPYGYKVVPLNEERVNKPIIKNNKKDYDW